MMHAMLVGMMTAHTLATAVAATEPMPVQQESPRSIAALTVLPLDTSQPLALTDAVIRKAVRDTIAEDPRPVMPVTNSTGAYGAVTPLSKFGTVFDEAKVPDCLHSDALRHQPATIGPINVVGPYSLPWVIAAAMRGKCH